MRQFPTNTLAQPTIFKILLGKFFSSSFCDFPNVLSFPPLHHQHENRFSPCLCVLVCGNYSYIIRCEHGWRHKSKIFIHKSFLQMWFRVKHFNFKMKSLFMRFESFCGSTATLFLVTGNCVPPVRYREAARLDKFSAWIMNDVLRVLQGWRKFFVAEWKKASWKLE